MKYKIKTSDFDFEYTGSNFTEKEVIANNFHQLSGSELFDTISNKVVFGDYLMGYKHITELFDDGTAEGINDAGSHNFGTWLIDMDNHTLATKWRNGWIDTINRAYNVNGNIELFDIDTGRWRTSFKTIKDVRKA